MIVRNDITAETYYPLPISGSTGAVGETALAPEHSKAEMCERVKLVLRDHLGRPGRADDGFAILKETLRVHAPDVELDLGYTDTGVPFVSVTGPGDDFDDAPPCITRGEQGWQMHRGGDGPLYQFATAQEVAEFVGSRVIRPRW